MSATERVRLDSIAEIRGGGRLGLSGKDFVPEGFPAFGAGGQNGYLPVYEYDRPGVVLSAIGARCGKCFFVEGKWSSLANTQIILTDEEKVDPRFLWHQLNDERRWPRSGTGQPFIKPSDVKAHEVWVPSLDEQRRIACLLDDVASVGLLYRRATALLIELKAALLHQVVERAADAGGRPLGEVCRPKQYPTISKSEMRDSGYPVYGANGPIGFSDTFTHDEPVVLVGCRGSCGTVHLAPANVYATGNAMALDAVDASCFRLEFLAEWLRYRGLADVTTGSSQPQITAQNLRRVSVPLVSLQEQDEFVLRWRDVEGGVNLFRSGEVTARDLELGLRSRFFGKVG